MSKFGLADEDWALLEDLLIAPAKDKNCQIWIFGSRARGDHQNFSDLDVLIDGNCSRDWLGDIQERMEESALPIKVDIVLESELADSYRESVYRDRVKI